MLLLLESAKNIASKLTSISKIEVNKKTHEIEIIGERGSRNVIITLQVKEYTPREKFGKCGYSYKSVHHKTMKNGKTGEKKVKEIPVTIYKLSNAEKNFIHQAYIYSHLTQKQISTVSGIPQEVVYRYIRQKKLKPRYSIQSIYQLGKKDRFKIYTLEEIDDKINEIKNHQEKEFLKNIPRFCLNSTYGLTSGLRIRNCNNEIKYQSTGREIKMDTIQLKLPKYSSYIEKNPD